jgi:hypothetical protein
MLPAISGQARPGDTHGASRFLTGSGASRGAIGKTKGIYPERTVVMSTTATILVPRLIDAAGQARDREREPPSVRAKK